MPEENTDYDVNDGLSDESEQQSRLEDENSDGDWQRAIRFIRT